MSKELAIFLVLFVLVLAYLLLWLLAGIRRNTGQTAEASKRAAAELETHRKLAEKLTTKKEEGK